MHGRTMKISVLGLVGYSEKYPEKAQMKGGGEKLELRCSLCCPLEYNCIIVRRLELLV